MIQELARKYRNLRHQHPGWRLLVSPRAPLLLSCLKPLFEENREGILYEDAQQLLARAFESFAGDDELEINADNILQDARRELRKWIRSKLVVERDGKLLPTDALQKAFYFADSLTDQIMTSTSSRLSLVQREIESLESRLNPSKESRIRSLSAKIEELKKELAEAEAGRFEVLDGDEAKEGILEVFTLAVSLRSDFNRVEDSYREADRKLRQSIIGEKHHRGDIVDKLLDNHDNLLETQEGRVFHGFYEQLSDSVELQKMKDRLRNILANANAERILSYNQKTDLRYLVSRLVAESERVIRARARSERDVKGFLKTGLAVEHHRVGALLNDIHQVALDIDWAKAKVRRAESVLPPVAISWPSVPAPERLRFKSLEQDDEAAFDLTEQSGSISELEEEFWTAFDMLDRQALFEDTVCVLREAGRKLSLSELAEKLPPQKHDLETLAYWLSMAREGEITFGENSQVIDLFPEGVSGGIRFFVPDVNLAIDAVQEIDSEVLG